MNSWFGMPPIPTRKTWTIPRDSNFMTTCFRKSVKGIINRYKGKGVDQ